ncbi:hypothetical protein CLF_109064 [Clonorchis sinensis]|uniref:Uncharacterized protein n=1 Tax=Clonorchis sinensis TaxID=79923 RepID=G7YIW5_CLOSI|nr:hypothetical protein CLF_109064 [Clonorchis sinensis]
MTGPRAPLERNSIGGGTSTDCSFHYAFGSETVKASEQSCTNNPLVSNRISLQLLAEGLWVRNSMELREMHTVDDSIRMKRLCKPDRLFYTNRIHVQHKISFENKTTYH